MDIDDTISYIIGARYTTVVLGEEGKKGAIAEHCVAAIRPPTTPPISIRGGARDGRVASHWSGGRDLGGRCNRWVENSAATRQFDRPTQPPHARKRTERITRAARDSHTATGSVHYGCSDRRRREIVEYRFYVVRDTVY
ncbi:unnamed protein product [Macrosiphum euphorbiae]|uniref:Uncharacterized protein n=1 Tax=Macrosiphum euphorbiae TaxID=13131 RepID=A0AAV0W357_9HEMI|nr:unnamed protein product [Macrosiphum euphorbiae]